MDEYGFGTANTFAEVLYRSETRDPIRELGNYSHPPVYCFPTDWSHGACARHVVPATQLTVTPRAV